MTDPTGERIADGWYVMTRPNSGDDILQRVEDGCIDDGAGAFARTLADRGYIFRPVEIIPAEERKRWHDINDALIARIAALEVEFAASRWEPVAQSLEYDLITHAIKHGEIPQGYRICRSKEPMILAAQGSGE